VSACNPGTQCVSTASIRSPSQYLPPWTYAPSSKQQAWRCATQLRTPALYRCMRQRPCRGALHTVMGQSVRLLLYVHARAPCTAQQMPLLPTSTCCPGAQAEPLCPVFPTLHFHSTTCTVSSYRPVTPHSCPPKLPNCHLLTSHSYPPHPRAVSCCLHPVYPRNTPPNTSTHTHLIPSFRPGAKCMTSYPSDPQRLFHPHCIPGDCTVLCP
jgi:hypothetical protein